METTIELTNGKNIKPSLWQSCLRKMLDEGVAYGKQYEATFFEKELRCERASMEFGLAVHEIRKGLEKFGCYLSGQGGRGDLFVIIPAGKNHEIGDNNARRAACLVHRGLTLCEKTPLSLLNDIERRKHEATTRRLAWKYAMLRRPASFVLKHGKKESETVKRLTEVTEPQA